MKMVFLFVERFYLMIDVEEFIWCCCIIFNKNFLVLFDFFVVVGFGNKKDIFRIVRLKF